MTAIQIGCSLARLKFARELWPGAEVKVSMSSTSPLSAKSEGDYSLTYTDPDNRPATMRTFSEVLEFCRLVEKDRKAAEEAEEKSADAE